MSDITLKGNPIKTAGDLPDVGTPAPAFTLVKNDLSEASLSDFEGKKVVLNIFPSIDTPVCSASVKRFNEEASRMTDTAVLCISADLPFALGRFCGAEGLKDVTPLSVFRSPEFGKNYGVLITTGPLAGVLSRAIVVIDGSGKVSYTEQVPEITQEPNFDAALSALA
ncbi:MAG: thiol peroxidase [Nitrospiria bacterium]